MKVNCQVYSPNFVGERENGGKTHEHIILLLDSIKYTYNFSKKKMSNNLLIKAHFKPTCLYIVWNA